MVAIAHSFYGWPLFLCLFLGDGQLKLGIVYATGWHQFIVNVIMKEGGDRHWLEALEM